MTPPREKAIRLVASTIKISSVRAIYAYRGFQTDDRPLTRVLLGIGSPLVFAVIWGTFIAPKAAVRLQEPRRSLLEILLFGLAVYALFSLGKTSLAAIFGAIYVIHKVLMVVWKQ